MLRFSWAKSFETVSSCLSFPDKRDELSHACRMVDIVAGIALHFSPLAREGDNKVRPTASFSSPERARVRAANERQS